jgi:hypothetical protein
MATVEQTTLKVQRLLTGPMGLRVQLSGDSLMVTFANLSTSAFISVRQFGNYEDGQPRTLVRVSAPVLSDVRPSAELYEWVAREGGSYFFGHVNVMDDASEPGRLFLHMTHTLLGDYLDEDELAAALYGVLGAADELDDQLQQRFGGQRWIEA